MKTNQFDVADPRVRMNLELHLAGRRPHHIDRERRVSSRALEVFGEGAIPFDRGETARGIETWRTALALDPHNFLIRSQI